MPAALSSVDEGAAQVVIKEGKFHQVKRMFAAVGIDVLVLERVAFAGITLDKGLPQGEYRPLNMEEMHMIEGLLSD
ncbi:MAG: 16S rRNA pseudouridine(516) synthase, partial [Defluviitaleaceae bacterium]|nr:16S rRNA pseudouridine(516) synthase [Defluviitaleaceae bacterium]